MIEEPKIPKAVDLPIENLVASPEKMAASYKMYWLLAILEILRETGESEIPVVEIIKKMLILAYYPSVYCRLNFGSADQLGNVLNLLPKDVLHNPKVAKNDLKKYIEEELKSNVEFQKKFYALAKYVPFRFLTPWFQNELKGTQDGERNEAIFNLAKKNFQNHQNLPLYQLTGNSKRPDLVIIQPRWKGYLLQHYQIVKEFAEWNLAQYLQARNPNVPGIPLKLYPPPERDLSLAKTFWQLVLPQTCIYSKQPLNNQSYDLDHFLPWSFVVHDHVWNIIPVNPSANREKSDALPKWDVYFPAFAKTQFQGLKDFLEKTNVNQAKNKVKQEYYLIGLTDLKEISEEAFINQLEAVLRPQYEIAQSSGYPKDWVYQKN